MGYSRSRAKCMPLQYPLTATRGVKEALISKPFLRENLTVVSMPLQEKINTSNMISNFNRECANHVSQSENGMFYELLNRKGMECEKYQDCSWFQSDCKNKLSPAEIFDPLIDASDFNTSMQCAEAHIPQWGDEYLEVFTDDIIEENYKLKEKKNHIDISNENFYDNYEGNYFDSYNINFSLKKSDSVDSMKNISLTNPSEVIPITYKERLNNPNYEQAKLNRMKSEMKELHLPISSDLYAIDSEDTELNIGREEEVEEMNVAEDAEVVNKKKPVNVDQVKSEILFDEVPSDYEENQNSEVNKDFENMNYNKVALSVKLENDTDKRTVPGKLDLNLDIPKLSFEPSMNMNTPDIDFMDLVDFINEEMRQECNISALNSTSDNIDCQKGINQDSTENYSNAEKVQLGISGSPQASPLQDQPLLNRTELEISEISLNHTKNSAMNFDAQSNTSVSIAERIKTSAKRKTRRSLREIIDSEDDGGSGSSDEDSKDEDYDYREDLVKQRSLPVRRQRKSSSVDSRVDGLKEEIDSYRERRDKNNEASRRSRQNRKAREKHLFETLEEEERRNVKLKAEADVLEKQVTSLRQLLLQVVLHKGGGAT